MSVTSPRGNILGINRVLEGINVFDKGRVATRVPINTPVQCPHRGRLTKLLPSHDKLCKYSFHFPVGSTCLGEQVPTFGAHRLCYEKQPTMAPKRASSKAVPSIAEAAKAVLLAEKKGKALADNTPQEAFEDEAISKRQRQDHPTLEGTLRTCSSGGVPQAPPPGFAPPEGKDAIEDGEVIGISTEDQLQLRALCIKNHNLQEQKEILEAKRQCVTV
jgi:hypothetical protein